MPRSSFEEPLDDLASGQPQPSRRLSSIASITGPTDPTGASEGKPSTSPPSLWSVAVTLKFLLPVVFFNVLCPMLFISQLPSFAGTYFAKAVFHAPDSIDCGTDYPKHSTLEELCTKGSGRAVLLNGIANGIASLLTFVLAPLVGQITDIHGRKWFVFGSQLLAALPIIALFLAIHVKTEALYLYYVGTVLSGLLNTTALALAYAADLLTEQTRGPGFGLVLCALSVALLAGPAIGGYMSMGNSSYLSMVVVAMLLAWVIFILPESLPARFRTREKLDSVNPIKPLSILGRTSMFRKLTATVILNTLCEYGKFSVLSYYLNDVFGWKPATISNLIIVAGVSGVISQTVLLKPLLAKVGAQKVVCIGMAGITMDAFLWGVAGELSQPYANIILFFSVTMFAGMGFFGFPAVSALKSNNVAFDEQGHVQGALYGARALSQGTTQVLTPILYAALSESEKPVVMGVLGMFGLASVAVAMSIPRTNASGKAVSRSASRAVSRDVNGDGDGLRYSLVLPDDDDVKGGEGGDLESSPRTPLLTKTAPAHDGNSGDEQEGGRIAY